MRIYVGGLPYQTTEQDLLDLFAQVGHVTSARSSLIANQDEAKVLVLSR